MENVNITSNAMFSIIKKNGSKLTLIQIVMNYLTIYFSNKHISELQNLAFVFPLKKYYAFHVL